MLQQIMGVEIPLYPQMSEDEIQLRLEQEEAAQLALQAFCTGQITLEEYLDILKLCEVDIDKFLINLEQNITETGLIII